MGMRNGEADMAPGHAQRRAGWRFYAAPATRTDDGRMRPARGLALATLCAVLGVLVLAAAPAPAATGNAQILSLGSGGVLPDGRVFEMVTPPEDHHAEVYVPAASGVLAESQGNAFVTEQPFQASTDGDAVAYVSQVVHTTSGGNGNVADSHGNQYVATRASSGGWTPVDISPPRDKGAEYEAFSSDLSVAILTSYEEPHLAPSAPGGHGEEYQVLYSRPIGKESYAPFFTGPPSNRNAAEFGTANAKGDVLNTLFYAGASTGLEHLLFEANASLTSNAANGSPGQNNLYDSVGGQLHVVNVLPNEAESTPGASFGPPQPRRNSGENPPDFSHVISEDGSRIFWTDLNTGDLYVRENGTTTVQVDASQKSGAPSGSGGGWFWTASSDGSKVFFTDCKQLTAESTAVSSRGCGEPDVGEETGNDLYEYEVNPVAGQPGMLTDLTVDTNASDPLRADVQGVIGASEDGEYVYFVAKGILSTAQNGEGEKAASGEDNLYVYEPDPTNPGRYVTRFIATLLGLDDQEGGIGNGLFGDWQPGLGHRTAEVTPSGKSVAFISHRALTHYVASGIYGSMSEVFVYNADTNMVICASCDPGGGPPLYTETARAAYLPASNSNTYLPRWISEDDGGSRVFFDSFEPLVPLDTNDRQDVYEWEQEDVGSCPAGSTNGCIYLLSGGISTDASYLIDASSSGNDVFIATRARLVPQDRNDNVNLFDARVGGVQPVTPTACSGTGCQGVPPAPPIFATPASVTFNGVGNFPPPPPAVKCAKGKKRSHGRCVKTKSRKKNTRINKAKKSTRDRRAE